MAKEREKEPLHTAIGVCSKTVALQVVLREDFLKSFISPFAISTSKPTQKRMWRRHSTQLFGHTRPMEEGGYNVKRKPSPSRLWEMRRRAAT